LQGAIIWVLHLSVRAQPDALLQLFVIATGELLQHRLCAPSKHEST
jgi:hypothetical protein